MRWISNSVLHPFRCANFQIYSLGQNYDLPLKKGFLRYCHDILDVSESWNDLLHNSDILESAADTFLRWFLGLHSSESEISAVQRLQGNGQLMLFAHIKKELKRGKIPEL